ncbi:hypothetical protein NS226_16145 [Aureimonas ureilytica]|uniref:HTH araC/xylS-type domain-containing protein n=1 Tax=Aureimonas ureilytica TaxID=401562 RepID=A0A175R5R9_9HYPH|nr:helix-turn-helix domain-containing protein [Aureimonas ureilytica]KTQ90493.1 hypothetical protein NS226_16145 [Aureimonas ureilytica]
MSENKTALAMNHALPALRISSRGLPAQEALRLWSGAIAQLRAELTVDACDHIFVDVSAWLIGSSILCTNHVSPACLSRAAEQLIPGPQGHVSLFHIVGGEWEGEIGGQPVSLGAGDLFCLESSQGFRLSHSWSRFVVLVVPREALSSLMSRIPPLHGERLTSPSAHVLAAHLSALSRHAPSLGQDEATSMGRGTLALVSAALREIEDRHLPEREREPMTPTLRIRVERHIEQNLSSNALTPEAIARDLHIPRSSLYRAFAPLGGISSYIQTRRLDTACALLRHPEEHRSMGELAEALGFDSTASFSKAFRRRFGCSPREARSKGLPTLGNTRTMFEAWLQLQPAILPPPRDGTSSAFPPAEG